MIFLFLFLQYSAIEASLVNQFGYELRRSAEKTSRFIISIARLQEALKSGKSARFPLTKRITAQGCTVYMAVAL